MESNELAQFTVSSVLEACTTIRSGADATACVTGFADLFGWKCTLVLFGYLWITTLFGVHSGLVRACCGRLRGIETGMVSTWVSGYVWKSLIFTAIVLAPADGKEWGFWYLWFTSVGLLRLLTNVAKQHFEHVVDNPRFGIVHTLRALSLHVLILCMCVHLASVGWIEFYYWGSGPIGQVLVSCCSSYGPQRAGKSSLGGAVDVCGALSNSGTIGSCSDRAISEHGGVGFALMLLYELLVIFAEAVLSALKYLSNLGEIINGHHGTESGEGALLEQVSFFVKLGLAISSGARTLHIFRSCVRCRLSRKCFTWTLAIINGALALEEIHRAAWKVVLAREMDVAFPDATEQELKKMAKDEACPICLKIMLSAKKLACNHYFHAGCLQQYLNNSAGAAPLCPICRAEVPWQPAGLKGKRDGTRGASGETRGANEGGGRDSDAGTRSSGARPVEPHQERPGIFTGNAPRPDSFTRGARGAYAAARLVHNVARAWRNGFNVASAATAAALAEEQANARSREHRRNQMAARVVAGRLNAVEEIGENAEGIEDVASDLGADRELVSGSEQPSPAIEDVVAVTEVAIAAVVVEEERHGNQNQERAYTEREMGRLEGSSGGARLHGMTPEDTAIVRAAAERLMEIFPDMGQQHALRRAWQARRSVQRVAEDVPTALSGSSTTSYTSARASPGVSASLREFEHSAPRQWWR